MIIPCMYNEHKTYKIQLLHVIDVASQANMCITERNQAMQHTKAEGCAKKGEIKNFTCIVLHQMKNSLPKIQFAYNT